MFVLKGTLKRILQVAYLIRSVNWIRVWKKHKWRSKNLVLINAGGLRGTFIWLSRGAMDNDFALINACSQELSDFRIKTGYRKTMQLKKGTIFHNLSKLYDSFAGQDYSDSLLNLQKHWLGNGNRIVPRHEDTRYWENKIYMHRKFVELDVSHPRTVIVDRENPAPLQPPMPFPFLFKPAHSAGSRGIEKIENESQYKEIIQTTGHSEYMLQELVEMRRDLRLIYIGDELVLHYWRINKGDEWRPTSTTRGSSVDFESLPVQWMDFLFQEYKKLNLLSGAFDITWRNDDLSTRPLILEVSPSFMPNPVPTAAFASRPYSDFKKNLWGRDAYYKKYIDAVFELKSKLIKVYEKH